MESISGINKETKIMDIDFDSLQMVKKKCITYRNDGNKVVKPYKCLYCVSQLTNMEEHAFLFLEIIKGKNPWDEVTFCLFEDLGVICSKVAWVQGYLSMEEFVGKIGELKSFGKEGLLNRLKTMEEQNYHISLLEIELCNLLGETEYAMHLAEYRAKHMLNMQEKRERERAELEQKKREAEERHLAEVEKRIENAIHVIRSHGVLDNEKFEESTIVTYLFKKFGIMLPLRTQGWVNKALARILYQDGKITYMYYTHSSDSTVFHRYLTELEEKIMTT